LRRLFRTGVQAIGCSSIRRCATSWNLAAILHRRGALEDAKALYQRALAIKETVLGVEHPELASTLNNLATLSRSQRQSEQATLLYGRAITLLEPSVERTHPGLAACRANYQALLRENAR
jgi:tetratricopeptide (TPR) repeat protein